MKVENSNQSIGEIAASFLDEDKLKAFMVFNDFLGSYRFGKGKTGRSTWAIKYKNRRIGSFAFRENVWTIRYFDLFYRIEWFERSEKYLTAELKDFILASINTTSDCCIKKTCHSIENKIILGKMFNSRICACGPIMVINPEDKTLEFAKELVLIGKKVIDEWRQAV